MTRGRPTATSSHSCTASPRTPAAGSRSSLTCIGRVCGPSRSSSGATPPPRARTRCRRIAWRPSPPTSWPSLTPAGPSGPTWSGMTGEVLSPGISARTMRTGCAASPCSPRRTLARWPVPCSAPCSLCAAGTRWPSKCRSCPSSCSPRPLPPPSSSRACPRTPLAATQRDYPAQPTCAGRWPGIAPSRGVPLGSSCPDSPTPGRSPCPRLWGNRDPALGRAAAEGTARHVTGDYLFIEIDAGHWLPENHADQVVETIIDRIEHA